MLRHRHLTDVFNHHQLLAIAFYLRKAKIPTVWRNRQIGDYWGGGLEYQSVVV